MQKQDDYRFVYFEQRIEANRRITLYLPIFIIHKSKLLLNDNLLSFYYFTLLYLQKINTCRQIT